MKKLLITILISSTIILVGCGNNETKQEVVINTGTITKEVVSSGNLIDVGAVMEQFKNNTGITNKVATLDNTDNQVNNSESGPYPIIDKDDKSISEELKNKYFDLYKEKGEQAFAEALKIDGIADKYGQINLQNLAENIDSKYKDDKFLDFLNPNIGEYYKNAIFHNVYYNMKSNKDLIIQLLQKNKLPIFKKLSLGGNIIYITSLAVNEKIDFSKKNYLDLLPKECSGPKFTLGEDGVGECVAIIKNGNNYNIKYGIISLSRSDVKIKNGYIYSKQIGQYETAPGENTLYDKDMNIVQISLWGAAYGDDYSKGGNAIKFHEPGNGEIKGDKTIILSKYFNGTSFEVYSKKFPNSIIDFNIEQNDFNGDKFEFKINGAKTVMKFSDYFNSYYSNNKPLKYPIPYDYKGDNTYQFEKINKDDSIIEVKKTGNNKYLFNGRISSVYEIDENYKKSFGEEVPLIIKRIELLSCKDNGDKYDDIWYNITSLKRVEIKSEDGYKYYNKYKYIFSYSVDKDKYGNLCKIPYKVRYYINDKDFFEGEYAIKF